MLENNVFFRVYEKKLKIPGLVTYVFHNLDVNHKKMIRISSKSTSAIIQVFLYIYGKMTSNLCQLQAISHIKNNTNPLSHRLPAVDLCSSLIGHRDIHSNYMIFCFIIIPIQSHPRFMVTWSSIYANLDHM